MKDSLKDPAMMTRRALWFSGPRRVEVVLEPLSRPPAGNLLARTLVSAISAGTELLAYRGDLPATLIVDETLSALGGQAFSYPFRFGYAQVAEVVETGPDVDPSWVGKRIFAFATHASAFVIPAADAVLVPADVSSEQAALLAHAETAVNLLLDGQPLLGENVVVMGLGTIGWLTASLLSRFPLGALAIVDGNANRLGAAAIGLGPRAVATAATAEEIGRLMGARGADLVYELTGDPGALNLALEVTGHEGRVVVGSWYGTRRGDINLGGSFHRRRIRILSSQVSHIGAALSARWDRARRFETAWTALREVDTLSLVSHRVPFAEAQSAYQLLDQGRDHGRDDNVRQVLLIHDDDDGGHRGPG